MRRRPSAEGSRAARGRPYLVAAAGIAAAGAMMALGPTACYLARGAVEEAKILARRRSIRAMIADPRTDPVTRDKLRVVEAARLYARDSLGLAAKESFTTYSYVKHDTLVLVLSAAYRDTLKPYTWWFPIVGRVPYKGYFDFAAARRAAASLRRDGYDTYLRPSDAFSTLGFFNDPLLNTTLRGDTLELANTVIHELTHNTYYAAGQVFFNESFATFVGYRGAAAFFRARGDAAAAARVDDEWRDTRLLGAFWSGLSARLDSAFAAHPNDRAARLAARDSIYRAARVALVDSLAPRFRTIPPAYAERVPLDNAALLARRVYASGLDLFDVLWRRDGRDLRRTVQDVIAIARRRPADPLGALRAGTRGASGAAR